MNAAIPSRFREVRSRDNASWKSAVALATSARARRVEQACFLEGAHLVEAWLDHVPGLPRMVLAARSAFADGEVAALWRRIEQRLDGDPAARVPCLAIDDGLWREASQLAQGATVALVVDTPRAAMPARLDTDAVFLDRLQDPGNVGSILRSCAAAGVRDVFAAPGTAFCWAPKVLRAAQGAHWSLAIHEGTGWAELAPRVAGRRYATRLRDARPIWDTDLTAPGVWLLGHEGQGLDETLLADDADVTWVQIPQSPGVESLNVAAAAAVCLFEQQRQRRARGVAGR